MPDETAPNLDPEGVDTGPSVIAALEADHAAEMAEQPRAEPLPPMSADEITSVCRLAIDQASDTDKRTILHELKRVFGG